MRQFYSIVILVACALSCAIAAEEQALTPPHSSTENTLRLNISGWSPTLRKYQLDIFKELVVLGEPKFGKTNLEVVNLNMSTRRAIIALETGDIPLGFSTGWKSQKNDPQITSVYHYPFLKNLLGLRRIVVKADRLEEFKKIQTLSDLQAYSAGQGTDWPDSEIYRNHNIQVISAKRYENLFPMLKLGRFDFIPMSVLEVDELMRQLDQGGKSLAVVPDLYVFYPIPVYLRSSKKAHFMDQFVSYALKEYFSEEQTALRERVFSATFSEAKNHTPSKSSVIFLLDNAAIDKAENDAIMKQFKQEYLPHLLPEAHLK